LRTSSRGKTEAKSTYSPSKAYSPRVSTPPRSKKSGTPKRTTGTGSSAQTQKLKDEIAKLTNHVGVVEKERDFYYNKLREVEVLLQDKEEEKIDAKLILDVLYKADDADFEAPAEEDTTGEGQNVAEQEEPEAETPANEEPQYEEEY